MQYSITINQLAAHTLFPEMDLKDVAIVDFLRHFFSSRAAARHRISENNLDFYWISYGKLIEEMPLLKISNERVMKRRIDRLVSFGLMVRYEHSDKLNKSYFAFKEEVEKLYGKPTTYALKSTGVKNSTPTPKSTGVNPNPCTEKYRGTPTLKSTGNHNTLLDHNTLSNHCTHNVEQESSTGFSESEILEWEEQVKNDPFIPTGEIFAYPKRQEKTLAASSGVEKKKKVAPKKKKGEPSEEVVEVIEYLNLAAGKCFGTHTKESVRLISARLKQYDLQDLKNVIDLQCKVWPKGHEMYMYLRPSTLFNESKFESYHQNVQSLQNGDYAIRESSNKNGRNGNRISAGFMERVNQLLD